MVPPDSPRVPRVRGYSGIPLSHLQLSRTGVSPSLLLFPVASASLRCTVVWLLQPRPKKGTVWAIPRSLAATDGVSFDFLSYGYLAVSVPRVGFSYAMAP